MDVALASGAGGVVALFGAAKFDGASVLFAFAVAAFAALCAWGSAYRQRIAMTQLVAAGGDLCWRRHNRRCSNKAASPVWSKFATRQHRSG